jgi:hypothetical protein
MRWLALVLAVLLTWDFFTAEPGQSAIERAYSAITSNRIAQSIGERLHYRDFGLAPSDRDRATADSAVGMDNAIGIEPLNNGDCVVNDDRGFGNGYDDVGRSGDRGAAGTDGGATEPLPPGIATPAPYGAPAYGEAPGPCAPGTYDSAPTSGGYRGSVAAPNSPAIPQG